MTYSLSNNCTKNYYNRTLTVQVIVEDVVTWIFLRQCIAPAEGVPLELGIAQGPEETRVMGTKWSKKI